MSRGRHRRANKRGHGNIPGAPGLTAKERERLNREAARDERQREEQSNDSRPDDH